MSQLRATSRAQRRAGVALALLFASAGACAGPPDALDLGAYAGKVVLLDFWASWCLPCKESFPWMQQVHNRYAQQGLVVIAVDVDHDRKPADQFLAQLQPSFPIVFDPHGNLAERFGVNGMPASFYIDRNGRIRYTHTGFHAQERDAAERELTGLLAEATFSTARKP